MRQAAPVLNAAKQQCLSVWQPHGSGIEDAVDWIGPILPAENWIAGMPGEERKIATSSRLGHLSAFRHKKRRLIDG